MNLFNQDKWWPLGQKLQRIIHNGTLPINDSNKLPRDMCISNRQEFFKFRDNLIPSDLIVKPETENDNYVKKENIIFNDLFLDEEYPIDYKKSLSILIVGFKIEEVYYSKIFDTNIVLLDDKDLKFNYFSVCICDNMSKVKGRFFVLNKEHKKNEITLDNNYDDY